VRGVGRKAVAWERHVAATTTREKRMMMVMVGGGTRSWAGMMKERPKGGEATTCLSW